MRRQTVRNNGRERYGDHDSVHCSQYRHFASQTQHEDASLTQLEDLGEFSISEDGRTSLVFINTVFLETRDPS
jgi:hypothetical protein